ncbi:transglycosylase SLT domain-containing protein [Yersinia enterocolitica]|uniref:lytic transglycosylase domain-containing protein n=1 Tax=Yersinia enterocolitica TaxID=630 RepID=UPI001C8D9051|nr:lytic transglycosylase domain-containing protein [Yersinia enterocolitica]MBX9489991.1 transglycosylase SLT domain-containing protein [Yersinia enterocolitica]MBX9494184.1 transglycosylase SLT domain-containing protein [Yersinia enterocolitica]
MSNAETIKDFLVSLGFDLDEAGEKKFSAVVAGVTANVLKMGAVVEGAALAVVGFTTKIASGLDKVYFASQRTGASVAGIKALGYAASQLGVDAASAQGSLESLARFIRNSPGAEGFLNRLGIQTRSANGNMRDTSAIFTGLSAKLSSMPYYRANQYAQMLSIDENTLMAMRKGLGGFTADYRSMLKATGFDSDKAAVQSNKFMTSMRGLTSLLGMARDKIGADLAGGLSGSIDTLRKRIIDNFPKIEGMITRVIKAILWLSEVFGRMAYRAYQAVDQVIQWWKGLDNESKKLLGTVGAIIVAWRMLNSAFLMSPIGLITALVIGLGLLYDDYMTWKEGGNSLIDWAKWEPDIKKAKEAILWVRDKILELKDAVGGWQNVFIAIAAYVAGAWVVKMLAGFAAVSAKLAPLIASLTPVLGLVAYGGYLYTDKDNIVASAESSWDYHIRQGKRGIGNDIKNFLGIDNPWASKNEGDASLNPLSNPSGPRPTKGGAALLGWLQPTLTRLEALNNLPAGLLRSVAITESGGNQFAISGAGAKGLFQFMDPTAKDMGLKGNDVFDPEKSAAAAAKYLSMLLKMNGGDLDKALASYNWGIGNVQKHGLDLMPPETRNYIPKVRSNMPGGGLQQETNIYITGVSDPVSAGNEVAGRQTNVNARLTQQLSTPTR